MYTIGKHYKIILLFTILILSHISAEGQESDCFYIEYLELKSNTVCVGKMDALEYEEFIKKVIPVIRGGGNRESVINSTIYRIENNLKVKNTTISLLINEGKKDRLIRELIENKYLMNSDLYLDIFATSDMNVLTEENKENTGEEEVERIYNSVKDSFLLKLVKLQKGTLKMGDYFYHSDKERALEYYYSVFDFQHFRHRLSYKDDNYSISREIYSIQKKAFKKILHLSKHKKDYIESMKTMRMYNNCYRSDPEVRALLNKYLIELELEPLD